MASFRRPSFVLGGESHGYRGGVVLRVSWWRGALRVALEDGVAQWRGSPAGMHGRSPPSGPSQSHTIPNMTPSRYQPETFSLYAYHDSTNGDAKITY